jgi:hypothetical protein
MTAGMPKEELRIQLMKETIILKIKKIKKLLTGTI